MLRRAFLRVVEVQLEDGNPPETRETLDRLMRLGYSEAAARKLIASAVAAAVWRVQGARQADDAAAYIRDLAALPKLPES